MESKTPIKKLKTIPLSDKKYSRSSSNMFLDNPKISKTRSILRSSLNFDSTDSSDEFVNLDLHQDYDVPDVILSDNENSEEEEVVKGVLDDWSSIKRPRPPPIPQVQSKFVFSCQILLYKYRLNLR